MFGATKYGTGGCKSLVGASVKHTTNIGKCDALCKGLTGCKFYAYCAAPPDCGLFKNACGLIKNDKCELVTSLGRDKLVVYKMFEEDGADAKEATGGPGLASMGLLAGFSMVSVVGGIAIFRRVRGSAAAADGVENGSAGEE